MRAILTCATCFTKAEVDAGKLIGGLDLETWWIRERRQHCKECFDHTCWEPVDGSVCALDKGHPGRHMPWKDEYGDTPEGVEPLVGLWRD